ncbi:Alpha/Beta hydrolase protein [Protomyces lactucae-debilis]|uniref:Alpha/Beta hydrolase protein n=1 Tax=Protomyces lactucae-debilis TaxID=2754530 RepID=A0A1Y2FAM8_PROLT|nr:Alpha/Beta hydrolase protein [Protomyces lactucae-debilis]ORY80960.1 Alpha/Beta hydrolase protein [Protomyces lactucae-debilis]
MRFAHLILQALYARPSDSADRLATLLSAVPVGHQRIAENKAVETSSPSSHLHYVALHGLFARTPADFLETQRLVRRLHLIDLPLINSSVPLFNNSTTINSTNANVTAISKAASADGLNAIFGQEPKTPIGKGEASVQPGQSTARVNPAQVPIPGDLRTISDATYTTLLRYAKFCSATYVASCGSPNGAELIQQFGQNAGQQTSSMLSAGYIAQDDTNREFIVAFRGDPFMHGLSCVKLDDQRTSFVQASTAMPMVNFKAPTEAAINSDILAAFILQYTELDQLIQAALANKKGYGITFTGHGIGGCFALLSAIAFSGSLSGSVAIQTITYGAPRVGNLALANYIDSLFQVNGQARYLRITHGSDIMPIVLNRKSGYVHAGVEIFQSNETVGGRGVFQCSGEEDRRCSGSKTTFAMPVPQAAFSPSSVAATPPVPGAVPEDPASQVLPASASPPMAVQSPEPVFIDPARPERQSCQTCRGTECIDCYYDTVDTLGDDGIDQNIQKIIPGQPIAPKVASQGSSERDRFV